jgi:hypothetical protein
VTTVVLEAIADFSIHLGQMAWVSSEAQVILAKFFVACFGALSPSQSGFAVRNNSVDGSEC